MPNVAQHVRRALTVTAAASALTALTLTAPATSSAAVSRAEVLCATGYLCVQYAPASVVFVPAGQRHTFNPPVTMSAMTNLTGQGYCVGGNPNFGIGSGSTVTRTQTVNHVAPSPSGYCLT